MKHQFPLTVKDGVSFSGRTKSPVHKQLRMFIKSLMESHRVQDSGPCKAEDPAAALPSIWAAPVELQRRKSSGFQRGTISDNSVWRGAAQKQESRGPGRK